MTDELIINLSRAQFGISVAFHFVFVPLSIGLITFVLIFEILNFCKKKPIYRKMSNYFSEMFLVSYLFGIVTGLTMSLQIGTNWAKYSEFMADVFASPLAIEAMAAFFIESTFAGIWLFRRNRLSNLMRLITVSMIAFGTLLSGIWIMVANGFMQNPVGYEIVDGVIKLTDFWAVMWNPYAWYMISHTFTACILLTAYILMGVGSYHLLKNKENLDVEFWKKTLRIASIVALITSLSMPLIGNYYYNYIVPIQPGKIELIDSDGYIKTSFWIMLTAGFFMIAISAYTAIYFRKFLKSEFLKKMYLYLYLVPFVAIFAGWIVAESGRQPYIVYGLFKTKDGVSNIDLGHILFSLITIVIFYIFLFFLNLNLMKKLIIRGPIEEEDDGHE